MDDAGRAELSFGPMIGPFAELRQKLLTRGARAPVAARGGAGRAAGRQPRFPDWVSGACLLIRRAGASSAAGLLDERYFLYTEDVDLCAARAGAGWLVRFSPEAEVVHARGASRASAGSAAEQAYRRSQLAFYRKHHPGWAPVLAAVPQGSRERFPDTSKQDR